MDKTVNVCQKDLTKNLALRAWLQHGHSSAHKPLAASYETKKVKSADKIKMPGHIASAILTVWAWIAMVNGVSGKLQLMNDFSLRSILTLKP